MTPERPLPRSMVALLERLVPRARRAEVLGDLTEDYRDAQRRMGHARARLWLGREVASLAFAWAGYARGGLLRAARILCRDLQMAWRSVTRRAIASAGAAAMLAVGLLAVALSSALRHTLLDRPVSAVRGHEVQRVVAVESSGREQSRFSASELVRIEAHVDGTAALTAVGLEPALVRAANTRRQTLAEIVGSRHADVIGMVMQHGRPLMGPDFLEGATPAAVISEILWRDLFGRSTEVLGATFFVNGRPFSVVGVARTLSQTTFLGASVDVWAPLSQGDAFFRPGWRADPAVRSLSVFALPMAPSDVLANRLRRATTDLASAHPDPWRLRSLALTPATTLLGTQRESAHILSQILFALSVLILVVASANVGAMMLAGAAAGRRAMAIHAAIGAGPYAAARRLLIEGGLIGAAASLAAAVLYTGVRAEISEIALLPTLALRLGLPAASELLAALVPAGILAGLLMAAGPAAWVLRQATVPGQLAGTARIASNAGVTRARRFLVCAQMALCLVLVAGATLFARSLDRLTNADLGIVREGLIALDFDIEPVDASGQPPEALAEEALRRTRLLPGVTAASMASRAPVDTSTPVVRVSTPGREPRDGIEVTFNTITPGYFETVGTPLVRGRSFTDGEVGDVAIVNETLSRRLWPEGDGLGRALSLDTGARTVRVVGIARDARYRVITEGDRPHLFLPAKPAFGHALLIRTSADPRRMLLEVQDLLDEVGPGVAGFFPRTADDHLAIQLLPTRAASTVAAWLGALALVFSALGLYGLITWFAELRRTEMAIRLALGATRADVERLIIRQAFAIVGPGLLAGGLLSAAGALAARGLLFGSGGVDVMALGAAAGALVVLVVVASWMPARRAGRTDPASSLRTT